MQVNPNLLLSLMGVTGLIVSATAAPAVANRPSLRPSLKQESPLVPRLNQQPRALKSIKLNVASPERSSLNRPTLALNAPAFTSSSEAASSEAASSEAASLEAETALDQEPAEQAADKTPLSTASPTTVEAKSESATADASQHSTSDSNGLTILSPAPGVVVDVPAVQVDLSFPPHSQVTLYVNGQPVNEDAVGRISVDEQNQLVTQSWYGVSLQPGENQITAEGLIHGQSQTASTTVIVRGAPVSLSVDTLEAQIPADGRSTATVRGQLLDESGNPSVHTALVTLYTSSGRFVGEDFASGQPGFQVQAKDGQFTAQLQSALEADVARITAISSQLKAYSQIQFKTAQRPSIVSGVLDLRLGNPGLDFYDRFEEFDLEEDDDFGLTAQGQIFATGNIGEWLFTGAYNSRRPLREDEQRQNRYDDDDDFDGYIFGDRSTSFDLTPSIDHFYARLERTPNIPLASPDFILWGDYDTEEFASSSQDFSATSRQLHGAKLNYNLGDLQLSGFYGNNVEGFSRDIIAPDGTSGYYFFSQRLIKPGSEEVYIELEELERPGTIIERSRLSRGRDYDIDYDRGAIQFRTAMLRTAVGEDGRVLVRRIVANYQYESGDSSDIYALRGRYHFNREPQQETWFGATALRENNGNRSFSLLGADAQVSFGDRGQLIAEYAYSNNESLALGNIDGSAYRLELEGQITDQITGQAYYRHADSGFSNDATISFVPGQTRYGAELESEIGETTRLRLGYDHERNQGVATRPIVTLGDLIDATDEPLPGQRVDNRLTTITAGFGQRLGQSNLNMDLIWRDRSDRLNPNREGSSTQLRSRFDMPLNSRLSFNALNELTLSNSSDSVYSDRTQIGLDYQLMPGISLGLNQHWFTRGPFSGQSFTTLDLDGEYDLFERENLSTTLTGRYSVVNGISGLRGQGAVGLKQRWEVTPGLNLDLAYERIVGDLFGATAGGDRVRQPVVVGSNTSTLGVNGGDSFSVGAEYTGSKDLKASARYERSNSSGGVSNNIIAAVTGKISPSLSGLLRYDRSSNANQGLRDIDPTTELRLGLAYRDIHDDKFNALLRYEYRRNPDVIPESALFGRGTGSSEHLFATEAIYSPSWRWELYGKLALRQSESFLAEDLIGSSTTTLAQLRGTYRFRNSFDLVGEARWIGQTGGYSETGFVLEGGYYITPDLRLSGGYVFGRASDRDFDGSQSASGPYFGLTVKVNELFSGFGQQRPLPATQAPPSNEAEAE